MEKFETSPESGVQTVSKLLKLSTCKFRLASTCKSMITVRNLRIVSYNGILKMLLSSQKRLFRTLPASTGRWLNQKQILANQTNSIYTAEYSVNSNSLRENFSKEIGFMNAFDASNGRPGIRGLDQTISWIILTLFQIVKINAFPVLFSEELSLHRLRVSGIWWSGFEQFTTRKAFHIC